MTARARAGAVVSAMVALVAVRPAGAQGFDTRTPGLKFTPCNTCSPGCPSACPAQGASNEESAADRERRIAAARAEMKRLQEEARAKYERSMAALLALERQGQDLARAWEDFVTFITDARRDGVPHELVLPLLSPVLPPGQVHVDAGDQLRCTAFDADMAMAIGESAAPDVPDKLLFGDMEKLAGWAGRTFDTGRAVAGCEAYPGRDEVNPRPIVDAREGSRSAKTIYARIVSLRTAAEELRAADRRLAEAERAFHGADAKQRDGQLDTLDKAKGAARTKTEADAGKTAPPRLRADPAAPMERMQRWQDEQRAKRVDADLARIRDAMAKADADAAKRVDDNTRKHAAAQKDLREQIAKLEGLAPDQVKDSPGNKLREARIKALRAELDRDVHAADADVAKEARALERAKAALVADEKKLEAERQALATRAADRQRREKQREDEIARERRAQEERERRASEAARAMDSAKRAAGELAAAASAKRAAAETIREEAEAAKRKHDEAAAELASDVGSISARARAAPKPRAVHPARRWPSVHRSPRRGPR